MLSCSAPSICGVRLSSNCESNCHASPVPTCGICCPFIQTEVHSCRSLCSSSHTHPYVSHVRGTQFLPRRETVPPTNGSVKYYRSPPAICRTVLPHACCTPLSVLPRLCHNRRSCVWVPSGNGANNASPKAANTCMYGSTVRDSECICSIRRTISRCCRASRAI
jgi:hypothetical protein